MRYNTKVGYNFVLNLMKKEDFGYRPIRDIKVSDAQKWIMKLHGDGKGYSTLTSVTGRCQTGFSDGVQRGYHPPNPFDFKLVDVVPNDSQKRIAMTEEQQEALDGLLSGRTRPTASITTSLWCCWEPGCGSASSAA